MHSFNPFREESEKKTGGVSSFAFGFISCYYGCIYEQDYYHMLLSGFDVPIVLSFMIM